VTDWTALRWALQDRSDGDCEACGHPRGPYGVVHHRRLRSQGGGHDLPNLLVVHNGCHLGIHNAPRHAIAHGWIVPGWADPATVPVTVCDPRAPCPLP